jgi:3-oxoacyl-[acyl-carrier protein] reductase
MSRPVALVTGASRGIGAAIASSLAEAGFNLVLTSTARGGCRETEAHCRSVGAETFACVYESSRSKSADRLVAAALKRFGQVDVLVNNAGSVTRKLLGKMLDSDFEHVVAVNLLGPFYLCRRLIPGMVKRGGGRVINISSISATLGTRGATGYCASKWGLDGLTKSLAEEVRGTGVVVTSVLPGSVDTDMLKGSGFAPMMRPADVATVVRFLATDAPAAMQGSRVEVFG